MLSNDRKSFQRVTRRPLSRAALGQEDIQPVRYAPFVASEKARADDFGANVRASEENFEDGRTPVDPGPAFSRMLQGLIGRRRSSARSMVTSPQPKRLRRILCGGGAPFRRSGADCRRSSRPRTAARSRYRECAAMRWMGIVRRAPAACFQPAHLNFSTLSKWCNVHFSNGGAP
jgi:hypothetical protein